MRFALAVLLLLTQEEKKHFDLDVHEATKTFTYAEFLVVPVRVHLLQCKDAEALHCRMKDADVRRVFGKANRIWNKAGVALSLESIVTENAVVPEGFDENRLQDFKET